MPLVSSMISRENDESLVRNLANNGSRQMCSMCDQIPGR